MEGVPNVRASPRDLYVKAWNTKGGFSSGVIDNRCYGALRRCVTPLVVVLHSDHRRL